LRSTDHLEDPQTGVLVTAANAERIEGFPRRSSQQLGWKHTLLLVTTPNTYGFF
jgi:hypothetical protein